MSSSDIVITIIITVGLVWKRGWQASESSVSVDNRIRILSLIVVQTINFQQKLKDNKCILWTQLILTEKVQNFLSI